MLLIALLLAAAPDPRQVADLDAKLRASDSATAVLQRLCDVRSPGAKIQARPKISRTAGRGPREVREILGARPGEAVAYRRVELSCAGQVFSRAENWYLPARLTPDMRKALAKTATPFGVVVKALGYQRETLSATRPSREIARDEDMVLQHKAVLVAADGRPFSLVAERYSRAALAPIP